MLIVKISQVSFAEVEVKKSKVHGIVEIMEYIPNAIVSRTIIKNSSGNITAMSFDIGEELAEKSSPFNSFVQVIDGVAEIINGIPKLIQLGEGIMIPVYAFNCSKANQRL